MAKRAKTARTSKAVEAEVMSTRTLSDVKTKVVRDKRSTRSPISNLIVGLIAGFVYYLLFSPSLLQSAAYGLALFMLFNTIDYCILYYRLSKEKETK